MGILQRVALCYYVVALFEMFLPRQSSGKIQPGIVKSIPSHLFHTGQLLWWYKWHWLGGIALFLCHTALMYGVDVPPAFGEECGRGVLTPVCNAATYIDSKLFTVPHMYFPSNGGGLARRSGVERDLRPPPDFLSSTAVASLASLLAMEVTPNRAREPPPPSLPGLRPFPALQATLRAQE